MNKQEFEELKNEFALIIYNYEKFIKDNILLDYKYNARFFDLLQKVRYYEVENGLMARSIQAHNEGQDSVLPKILSDFEAGYKQELANADTKHRIAVKVNDYNKKVAPEVTAEFEKEYVEFIKLHHPVVHALAPKEEQDIYEKLKVYYYENNYEGFKKAYAEAMPKFQDIEYPEDMYTKISEYYYDIRKRIGQDFQKKQTVYPFIKKDVFTDEMSEAYEEGELKANLSKVIADNKKIHKDYVKTFGQDITFNVK
ncbi:MAG: hypothetical protein K6B64_05830 [Acholeplasmatales bacterium]|nr:hypothetical protein [Acholeplasmatales bacterium]